MGILYAPPAQAISATGGSAPINTSTFQNFWLSLVTGTPTGTTPTLTLHVDAIDDFGNVINDLVTLPAGFALTTVAGNVQTSFGVNGAANLLTAVPGLIQVRWVVTGTTPNYPNTQISLNGR
jgi:hypothetical protein